MAATSVPAALNDYETSKILQSYMKKMLSLWFRGIEPFSLQAHRPPEDT